MLRREKEVGELKERAKFVGVVRSGEEKVDIWSGQSIKTPIVEALTNSSVGNLIPGYTFSPERENADGRLLILPEERDGRIDTNYNVEANELKVVGCIAEIDLSKWPHLVNSLLEVARLNKGKVTMHAAAVSKEEKAVLLLGDKGSGKTSLLIELCRNFGYKMVGDDLVVVGLGSVGKELLAYPNSGPLVLRETAMAINHPDLLFLFDDLPPDVPWRRKTVVTADKLGIESEAVPVQVKTIAFGHVDARAEQMLRVGKLNNLHLSLILSENTGRYIKGQTTPLTSSEHERVLTFLPSFETPPLAATRVKIVNTLIDQTPVMITGPNVSEIAEVINERNIYG